MSEPSQPLQNFATINNNCIISDFSSQMPKGECENLLTPSRKDLWISLGAPPQHFTLEFTHLSRRGEYLNLFGLDCWHDYNTNPKVIELSASNDGRKFTNIGRFKCERVAGWQYMRFEPLLFPRFVKVAVLDNWGGEKTYINQVMLSEEGRQDPDRDRPSANRELLQDLQRFLPPEPLALNPKAPPNASANSNPTDPHLKLTSTEKQLKRVAEKVSRLERENQAMRERAKEQDSTILQMQQTVGMLLKNMEKMQKMMEGWNKLHSIPVGELQFGDRYADVTESVVSRDRQISNNRVHQQQHDFHRGLPSPVLLNPAPASAKITESISSRHRQKSSTGYSKKPTPSIHSSKHQPQQRDRDSSSDMSLHTENVRAENIYQNVESADKKRKIATLLESLQHKITLRNQMKRKLQSPGRRDDSDERSDGDDDDFNLQ